MKLLWLTDIHFDFLNQLQRSAYLSTLANQAPGAVLLGVDLSTARRLAEDLEAIRAALKVPVYFVLGNHDYYYGSIAGVREQMRRLSRKNKKLVWLEDVGYAHKQILPNLRSRVQGTHYYRPGFELRVE
jgi:predicted MPP superfamily phosphohydrolase